MGFKVKYPIIDDIDIIEMYKEILKGTRKKFANGTWQRPDAIPNAIKITKYLIEEKLKLSDNEIKDQLSEKLFVDNRLRGMLKHCFNDSPYKAINTIYPNRFKEWDFNRTPINFWNKEKGVEATKWLIEEKLKLTDEEIKEQLSIKLFADNDLYGMLQQCFNGSPYLAINTAYPNKFKEWEFSTTPVKFWNEEKGIEATKWLIEEKLKLTDEELKEQLSQNLFKNNNLGGMLWCCFNSSPYKAINTTYPNKFKEWEFKTVPFGFWTEEKGIEATKWLIEEKLKLTDEELKEQLSQKLFVDNKLSGMFTCCFNSSPYKAINTTYPNKFKEWEFKQTPNKFWTEEKGLEATKWLIEEKLKLTDKDLKEQLSIKLFKDNGLFGMLSICFNGSPYQAINETYPNRFKEWEFIKVPKNFWNKEKGIEITKWLIEEKLKLSDEEMKEQLSKNLFKDNNLSNMLNTCFNGSPYQAINETYPNKFKPEDFKYFYKSSKETKSILQKSSRF